MFLFFCPRLFFDLVSVLNCTAVGGSDGNLDTTTGVIN